MKKLALSVILIALLVSSTSPVHAFPDSVKKVEFWAPPVMLEGHEYNVIVVLVGYTPDETRFNILSNNENILSVIDREITIEPFKSHGIAKVKANFAGKVDLFAVSGEKLLKASVEVAEPALMQAKLDIVLPSNRIAVKQIPAYVFLLDSFNNPLRATEDIEVNVSSFGNIIAQVSNTVIKKGMHYSKFIIDIKGDGGISAAANNLQPDTEMIELAGVSDEIELKVEVAPDPLAISSSGEVYVWLENGGRPVVPKKDVKVTLVSEDSRFLAFSKAVHFSAPLDRDLVSTAEIFIKSGESYAHTMVWTTDFLIKNEEDQDEESEEITVTAIAEGFDSAETTVEIRKPVKEDPNIARIFVLPDPAVDKLDIIVALYFTEEIEDEEIEEIEDEFDVAVTEEELEQLCGEQAIQEVTGEDVETEEEDIECSFEPVAISESIAAHISTDSLLKAAYERVRLDKDDLDLRDHYTVIPAVTMGKHGMASVFGAADGTIGEKIQIRVEKPYSDIPAITVKSLPVLANVEQDMLLIYSVKDGVLTDSKIKDLVVSTRPTVEIENTRDVSSLKIVKGRSPDLASGTTIGVTALARGFASGSAMVSPFNPEIRNLVSYHPPTVHAGEPFPVVFYATDVNKHPIEIVGPSISPKSDMTKISEELFILSSSSEHNFVFYAEGTSPGTSKIETFSHEITLEVSISDKEPDLGDDIALTYKVFPTNAKIMLDTDLPYQRSDTSFAIEATIPGSHNLVLTAESDGFNSVSKEIQIEIRGLTSTVGSEGKEKLDIGNIIKPNFTTLLAYVGILVTIIGAVFYIFARKKLKRSPRVAPEGDLTYLFRGDSANVKV